MSDGGDDRTLSERLSAYLDGELDKNDADSIRKLIVTDSKIAKMARDLAEAKVRLESAYGDTRDEPISETTIDLIKNYPMGRPIEDRAEPVRSNIIPDQGCTIDPSTLADPDHPISSSLCLHAKGRSRQKLREIN